MQCPVFLTQYTGTPLSLEGLLLLTCVCLSCLTEVNFPLEHYTLELQDHRLTNGGLPSKSVALLDEKTAMVTAVQLGQTNLVFVHKSILFFFSSLVANLRLSEHTRHGSW